MNFADWIAARADGGREDPADVVDPRCNEAIPSALLTALVEVFSEQASSSGGAEDDARPIDTGAWGEAFDHLLDARVQNRCVALEMRAWHLALEPIPVQFSGQVPVEWRRARVRAKPGPVIASRATTTGAAAIGRVFIEAARPAIEIGVTRDPNGAGDPARECRLAVGTQCGPVGPDEPAVLLGKAVFAADDGGGAL